MANGGADPAPTAPANGGAGFRYRLLETIRQYAQERLLQAGEAPEARGHHLEYYLAWAERAAPEVIGRDQLIWFARIEAEMDNLRAALEWAAGDGTDRELRLAAALAHCWLNRGYQGEALGRLVGALDRGSPAPTRDRSIALDWAEFMELNRGNRARGRDMVAEAAAVAPAANDKPALATALRHVAMFAWNEEGPSAHLRAALDEAIAYALSDED